MVKEIIKNRQGQKVVVLVEEAPNQKGLVFIMHGLGGFKEQPHIATFAKAFYDNGYTAIRFDATNTLGESDGNYEDATVTNYYADLEDVIEWAKNQKWYQEPFVLAGHSLGGICVVLYAEKYPAKVKALAPISTVVSGKLDREAYPKEKIAEWEKIGWQIIPSSSKPGVMKKLKWHHYIVDALRYDLLPQAKKLTMPVLLMVGSEDMGTPLSQQKILFESLSGQKELHIIQGARHTFYEQKHLDEIYQIFDQWIKKIK